MLIDEGITNVYLFLYSLTKYCAIFAKMKGYFGMMISNNQHGIDSRKLCSWVVSEKGLSSLCSLQKYHLFIAMGK